MSRFARAGVMAIAFSMYPFAASCSYADDPEEVHEAEEEHEEGHDEHEDGHDEHDEHDEHLGHGDHEHEEYPATVIGPYFRTPGIQDGVVGLAVPAGATESLSHVEDMAANLRYLANHLTFEMHYNYQGNPGFQDVYAKCYDMRNLAYAIYNMEHSSDHVEMTGSIVDLHELLHSLEEDVAGWQRTQQREVGHGDLQVKLELMEDLINHLILDASARAQILIDSGETTAPPATGTPPAETVPSVD